MNKPEELSPAWPVLRRYSQRSLDRIILPVGGIGTGTIGFAGNGALRDWEIMNVPAKGYVPLFAGQLKTPAPSLLLRYHADGRLPQIKLLEGPMPLASYEGAEGCAAPNANLPRFRHASFSTAYPFGEVVLRDASCPLKVRLQAYNPLIPGDTDASGWPVAFFRCILTNAADLPVHASVAFSLPNFIGADGGETAINPHSGVRDVIGFRQNVNEYRKTEEITGIHFKSNGVDPAHRAWGTMSLTTPSCSGLTWRTSWADLGWGDMLLEFWDELLAQGRLHNQTSQHEGPMASLCAERNIAPGEYVAFPFLLAWHFPNRLGWADEAKIGDVPVGNYYTTRFSDAWQVAEKYWPEASKLELNTLQFVEAFISSGAPKVIKEASLFNLSTIRTQTCFRTADGRFFAWEGIFDRKGSCFGSCNHVWNYEQGLAQVFPELSKSMHRTAFLEAMDDRGMMPVRIPFPVAPESGRGFAAADGQMGHIVRVFREWAGGGDQEFLQEIWPAVKKAIQFSWIPGGWDADQDGVMEGCQHNTMDVEYYGPNPQMGIWYLAALRATSLMARHAGDMKFATKCEALFERGHGWMEEHLFNGEYFEHHIQPAKLEDIATGLRQGSDSFDEAGDPPLQLGSGCLIDQMVGEWAAQLAGIGPFLDREHAKKTLLSIVRYNRCSDMWDHFNPYRTYVMGDEAALLMASYPLGRRPKRPFPYFNEVMTGFEYVLAGQLLLEGFEQEGLQTVQDIRARYDGIKRNPFDEAECGHHYGRALASWGLLNCWSGFLYEAVEKILTVKRAGLHFWSCGVGWGVIELKILSQKIKWEIQVMGGELVFKELRFNRQSIYLGSLRTIPSGESSCGSAEAERCI